MWCFRQSLFLSINSDVAQQVMLHEQNVEDLQLYVDFAMSLVVQDKTVQAKIRTKEDLWLRLRWRVVSELCSLYLIIEVAKELNKQYFHCPQLIFNAEFSLLTSYIQRLESVAEWLNEVFEPSSGDTYTPIAFPEIRKSIDPLIASFVERHAGLVQSDLDLCQSRTRS